MEVKDLVKIIFDRPCTLFIGAGFSMDSGGPDGYRLLSELKHHFGDSDDIDILKYLEKIIGTNNDVRKEVERVIRNYLITLTPNDNQKYLFSIPWKAVLTTNYDLIPDFIETSIDKNREIIPFLSEKRESIDVYRNDLLYCFKLFGDINRKFRQEGHMILTETDRRYETTRLINILNLFSDISSSGNIIYLGYSFKDNLVLDILKDINRSNENIPWNGYVVKPTPLDKDMEDNLVPFNIKWVKGDVESFVKELKKAFTNYPSTYVPEEKTLVLNNTGLLISRKTQINCRNHINYIHNEIFEPISEDPILFFEGRDLSYYPYLRNWDMKRTLYSIEINTKKLGRFSLDSNFHILDRQLRGSSSENIKVALIGSSGSGKTVVTKRIAFNWYKNGHPVIFIEPKGYKLDKKVIEGFIEEILFNYQKRMEKEASETKLLRFLLVSDNQALFLDEIIELYDYLSSKEILIDLLVIDRITNLTKKILDEILFDGVYKIDDTLDPSDLKLFLEHFRKINLDIPEDIFKRNLEDASINESFFALMYSTIKESQKPLKEIIIDEYDSLNKKEKEVYALTSLLESLNMNIHKNLVSKYCKMPVIRLESEINEGRLNGILNIDYYENIITRHKIISEIIDKYEFFSSQRYFDLLNNIVDNFTAGNYSEEDFVHNLLISKITMDKIDIRITPYKIINLYERALEKMETRPLYHHLARNYRKIREYDNARMMIKIAKKTRHPRFGEGEKNLLDTQGRIELAEAQEMIDDEKDKDEIWQHLEKAGDFFNAAQGEIRFSPHPVQGRAQTYYLMGLITDDRTLRHNLCLLSLSRINYLNLNVEQSYKYTRSLERNVFSLFSEDFNVVDAENIINNYRNPNGYAYLAEKSLERDNYYNAERLIDKGLLYKSTLWLLRLKIQIINEIYSDDISKMDDYLSEYIKLNEYDLTLSFELGKYYFKLEDYKKSYNIFDELKNKSQGFSEGYRFNQKNILYEGKNMKDYRGEITELPNINKIGYIRCESLRDYSELIKLRIYDIKYENPKQYDRIFFNIYFTFEGSQAFNVTPR